MITMEKLKYHKKPFQKDISNTNIIIILSNNKRLTDCLVFPFRKKNSQKDCKKFLPLDPEGL